MSKHAIQSFILALIALPLLAQDYQIKLHRPFKQGAKYLIDAYANSQQKKEVSVAGKVLQSQDESYELTLKGTVTVNKVDKLGKETHVTLAIETLTKKDKGSPTETPLLTKGSTVTLDLQEENPVVTVDDKPASPELVKMLKKFFSKPEKTVDDDSFGTNERQKVGGIWKLNAAQASKDAAEKGLKVDPKHITGQAQLVKHHKVDGIPCLNVQVKMNVSDMILPLPPGTKIISASAKMFANGDFPVDPALHIVKEATIYNLGFVAEIPSGPGKPVTRIAITAKETKRGAYEPLK